MCISDFIKSAWCTILGGVPGLFLYFTNQNLVFLFVSFLGGFVGFGLSLRSTSISRVARLGVATILENNIPYSFGLNDRLLESDSEVVNPTHVAAKTDYRKLPRSEAVRLSDVAYHHLNLNRTEEKMGKPLRVIASLNEEIPGYLFYWLGFEDKWFPARDLYCVSNETDFIIDKRSARWMEGTTIDWQNTDGQEGFVFENPTWDSIAVEEMAAERTRAEAIAKSADLSRSVEKRSKMGWGLVGGIIVGALVILQIGLRMADVFDQQADRDSPVQAIKNEEANWNEKMKRGEDVPEALLTLANIEPANYKRYQEALRTKLALEKDESNKPSVDAVAR